MYELGTLNNYGDYNEIVKIDSLNEAMEKAIMLYRIMGREINVLSTLTGEVLFCIDKKDVYVSEAIKMVL